MQPTYLPYLGYFDLIGQANVFVFLDDVQFERRSWQSRNRIMGAGGEQMLTVPVKKDAQETLIRDIEIADDQPWREKHLAAVRHAYGKRPHFGAAIAFLEAQLTPAGRLADMNCTLIEAAARELGLQAEFVRASSLAREGKRSERLLAICGALGAEEYLSPEGSRAYIEEEQVFARAGLPVRFRSAPMLPYEQGRAFAPYMAFVDAAANLGWAGTAELLQRTRAA